MVDFLRVFSAIFRDFCDFSEKREPFPSEEKCKSRMHSSDRCATRCNDALCSACLGSARARRDQCPALRGQAEAALLLHEAGARKVPLFFGKNPPKNVALPSTAQASTGA